MRCAALTVIRISFFWSYVSVVPGRRVPHVTQSDGSYLSVMSDSNPGNVRRTVTLSLLERLEQRRNQFPLLFYNDKNDPFTLLRATIELLTIGNNKVRKKLGQADRRNRMSSAG